MKKFVLFLLIFFIPLRIFAITDTAKSTIVMDMDSGRILYEKNANEKRLIASVTKIMTAVVAIENGNLEEEVTAKEEILSMYGSNIYLELNEKMKLRDLLYGLLLRSGNDAAVVIATHIGTTEEKFVKLMNDKAKTLGMNQTIYKNSHGLDEEVKNYSTAKDLAILSSYANTLEEYKKISKTKKWKVQTGIKSYVWNNRNKLLYTYEYATGGKTGYTPSAGRTLVTSASKDNLNLTTVTLNDSNEYVTHKSLYEYCFDKYKNYKIVDEKTIKIDDNFFKDKIYIKESFQYPLTDKEKDLVKVIATLNKNKKYKNKDIVGNVRVLLDKEEIFKTNIYVEKRNKKNSVIDKIKSFFSKVF